ncbi:hypothetical protein MASR2M29_22600 [Spirochaetota bacterium]
MKTRRYFLSVILLLALSLAAADESHRIVMGGKAVTMVADAVYAFPGARSRVVAVGGTDQGLGTFLETVSPSYKNLPEFDRQAGVEVYASFRPDLVILKSSLKKTLGPGLDVLGIKTAYLSLELPSEYYTELLFLGELFNEQSRARELVAYYKNVVSRAETAAAIALKVPGVQRPRVLLLQASGDGFEVPPTSWIQTEMVRLAGGQAVWTQANPGSAWAKVGPEQIVAWNPDYIFVISYREDAAALADSMKKDRRYSSLKAVRDDRVLGFAQDFLSWDQPDTRWALGLLWLSNMLFPAAMPGFSIEKEARQFYELLYDFNSASFDAIIKPRLRTSGRPE